MFERGTPAKKEKQKKKQTVAFSPTQLSNSLYSKEEKKNDSSNSIPAELPSHL